MTGSTANGGLLSGVRVIEMGLWAAGPAAGGILADWGAEVIKIEPPGGDPMRFLFKALSGSKEPICPPFDVLNRGKLSVAIDVNHPDGLAIVERLIGTADVFLSNMRPSFLERAGLGYEKLHRAFPRLVYAVLTGYGLEGPDRDAPGYDVAAFSARSGVASRSTAPGEPPPNLASGMGDNLTGVALVAGVAAALYARERTGAGELVSASLLRAGIFGISMDLATRLTLGRLASPARREAPSNPLLNSYSAGDGRWFWLVGAESARHWPALVTATGDLSLGEDERFGSPRDRRRNAAALIERLDAVFAEHDRDVWAQRFEEHGVWWAPVNSVEDLLVDPQVQAAGAFVEVPGQGDGPSTTTVATPLSFGAHSVAPTGPVPVLGDSTEPLLREVGVTDAELQDLRAGGVLGGEARDDDG
jgi:crotonobetainyl-CoA:carnitine CoA-transferase CaiB-like acyl-CoA transferase